MKTKFYLTFICLLILSLFLSSCRVGRLFASTATLTATASLTPTATLTATPSVIPTSYPTAVIVKSAEMVLIPAGSFNMGGDIANPHLISLPAFYIDKYEVTNRLYKNCLAGGCTPPSGGSQTRSNYYGDPSFDNYPVVYVHWQQAAAFCAWRGGRLPTEAEWEYAARGSDERIYPWGNTVDPSLLDFDPNDTSPVGSYEADKSPFGVYDMILNVTEWVDDADKSSDPNKKNEGWPKKHITRGGSWGSITEEEINPTIRQEGSANPNGQHYIGFRCVMDAAPPAATNTPAPTPTFPAELGEHEIIQQGAQMALIPAASFMMGSSTGNADEKPPHKVSLEAFYIDKYEVTNALYRTCVDFYGCEPLDFPFSATHPTYYGNPAFDHYPVNRTTWDEAAAYCKWRGARLPTEAEWEYAARSSDGRTYPWGEGIDPSRLNYRAPDTIAVGRYENGKSPFGIYDMAGNAGEWVDGKYEAYLGGDPKANDHFGSSSYRIMRGGSWRSADIDLTATRRYPQHHDSHEFGFRCAVSYDATLKPVTASPPIQTRTPMPPENTPTPQPALGAKDIVQKDAVMVFIPGGSFTMGSNDGDDDEKPPHTVYVKPFYIDKYEVTYLRYRACPPSNLPEKDRCPIPQTYSLTHDLYSFETNFNDYPVNVNWTSASLYCAWRGARLPTEAEWEYAARGSDGRIYPWGNEKDPSRVNMSPAEDTRPVGSFEAGKSPFGVYDMLGNAWEWVDDWYGAYLDEKPDTTFMTGTRVLRGGSWHDSLDEIRVTSRSRAEPHVGNSYIGFRCAMSEAPEAPQPTPTLNVPNVTRQGAAMVLIPAGSFSMGSKGHSEDAKPPHQVAVNSFYMDIYEVTNALYKACADANICTPPASLRSYTRPGYYGNPTFDDFPVIHVNWNQAKTYCEWRGGRLPSEAEWEYAARGPSANPEDARDYPWGTTPASGVNAVDDRAEDTTRVGLYETGKSIFGLYDMSGNVWEWVSDWYDVYPGGDPNASPDFGQVYRGVRGDSWFGSGSMRISAFRYFHDPATGDADIGFRCAADTDPIPQVSATPTLGAQDKLQEGAIMALIPSGRFMIGSGAEYLSPDQQAGYAATISAFYMDKYEVTNALYKTCVDAGLCSQPTRTNSKTHTAYYGNPQFDHYPVIYVDWDQAVTYCKWRGGRLPTDAEWEYAARGNDGRIYPWGNLLDVTRVIYFAKDTDPVGSYPAGQSFFGLYDMAGNVQEWVHDWYDEHYYLKLSPFNPQGPASGTSRVVRGGAWDGDVNGPNVARRYSGDPTYDTDNLGFRCAATP